MITTLHLMIESYLVYMFCTFPNQTSTAKSSTMYSDSTEQEEVGEECLS